MAYLKMTRMLIAAKANVNVKTHNGKTPLFAAAKKGATTIVEMLLTAKADVNAETADGKTALREAAWGRHKSVVRLLVNAGADIMTLKAPLIGLIHDHTSLSNTTDNSSTDKESDYLSCKELFEKTKAAIRNGAFGPAERNS